jgi:hypothetical protein
VGLIQGIEKKHITDVEDIALNLIEIDVVDAEVGIGAAELEVSTGEMLGGIHHVGEGGASGAGNACGIDVIIGLQLLTNEAPLGVVADDSDGLQRKLAIQSGKVLNAVRDKTANGFLNVTNGGKATGSGIDVDTLEHVDNHITGEDDTFIHRSSVHGKILRKSVFSIISYSYEDVNMNFQIQLDFFLNLAYNDSRNQPRNTLGDPL